MQWKQIKWTNNNTQSWCTVIAQAAASALCHLWLAHDTLKCSQGCHQKFSKSTELSISIVQCALCCYTSIVFFFIWLALFNFVILLLPLLQWHLTGKLAPPTAYLNEPTPNIHWAVVDREAMHLVFSPLQCPYSADIWAYWSGGSKIPSNTVKCCHAKPRTCTLAFGYMAFYIFPC